MRRNCAWLGLSRQLVNFWLKFEGIQTKKGTRIPIEKIIKEYMEDRQP